MRGTPSISDVIKVLEGYELTRSDTISEVLTWYFMRMYNLPEVDAKRLTNDTLYGIAEYISNNQTVMDYFEAERISERLGDIRSRTKEGNDGQA